jgi:hypothetical protein
VMKDGKLHHHLIGERLLHSLVSYLVRVVEGPLGKQLRRPQIVRLSLLHMPLKGRL